MTNNVSPELEAVAKAFFESICEGCKWEDVPAAHAHNIEAARAALLAIRDHDTPEFLDAITAPLTPYADRLLPGSTAVSVWQAGLDQILKGSAE